MIRRVVFRGNVAPLMSAAAAALQLQTQSRLTSSSSSSPAATNRAASDNNSNAPSNDYFAFAADPKQPIDVLDAVLHAVSRRYGIPTNASDMRVGTVGAYRALGVLMQQYVSFLEKEGPSSPAALSAPPSSSSVPKVPSPPELVTASPLVSSLENGGVVPPKADADAKDSDAAAAKAESDRVLEEVRKASYTSLVSFLVRTLFSKHTTPMETPSIAEAINKQAEANRRARQQEFLSKLGGDGAGKHSSQIEAEEKAAAAAKAEEAKKKKSSSSSSSIDGSAPQEDILDSMNKAIGAKGQAIVERHFPITNNMRNLLSNFYHMPTHKMVPVLGRSGKGVGREFRDYFAGCGRVSLRFGRLTAGLYPAPTLPAPGYGGPKQSNSPFASPYIGTVSEITNVFELSHPRDNVIRAAIRTVRVDGTVIEASSDVPVILDPIAYAWRRDNPDAAIAAGLDKDVIVDHDFFNSIEKDVGSALATLDRHRPKKRNASAAAAKKDKKDASSSSAATSTTSSTAATTAASEADAAKKDGAEDNGITLEALAKEMQGVFAEGQSKGEMRSAHWVGAHESAPPGAKIELASYPHVSVDVLIDVVLPPRRFVPDYEFYEDRITGGETAGQRAAVAKMLAVHSATRVTRFANKVYRMFTGKELKIDITNNTTIDMLARRTGMADVICTTDATGAPTAVAAKDKDGNPIPKYPYESKVVTMVYCFRDREWAIDNVKVLLPGIN